MLAAALSMLAGESMAPAKKYKYKITEQRRLI